MFSWVEENNSNDSTAMTGPLMAKLTPQHWLECLSCVLEILPTSIFSLTCFNLGFHKKGKLNRKLFWNVILKFHKYLFNCESSLLIIFPQAKSQPIVAVVKLEDGSREKREEERKSKGLLSRLGLITRVVAWWHCWVDVLRGLVLLSYRIKQSDLSFEETIISF